MTHDSRGHVGIAMLRPDHDENVGSVLRGAGCFDADYVALIESEYGGSPTDVGHGRHVPRWEFDDLAGFLAARPADTTLVAVHVDESARPLRSYRHPERAVYLLGEEGPGFDRCPAALDAADSTVYIPSEYCLNVAVAANVVLADRYQKPSGGDP